ncbi:MULTISPECIES: primosomal replication protein N [unclassified Massilia]|uniref:primosomal replication protein N n=1 Tax=unclassified Massilia TaxID=2609279 RepID=UPI0015938CD0|nr:MULTISPECIES: primosomal replication protein N [unclassified Massilia]NVD98503.1 primosomal replication protein N [Massilia sp. BJB1822]UTY60787.1 primosomal replication protein N [Massilia sp. erpn]
MNQTQFVALIAEREMLRYTPAGLPIVNAVLQHRSQQMEAGIARLTEFEIAAVAAGEISNRFSQAALGGMYEFRGFLAKKSRNSKSLVFHIIDFRAV